MFKTVLVANRGEIALRVIRTCRELGIRTVAVYSTPDRDSAAVRAADEAFHIGPSEPRRSYLNPAAIVEVALRAGAEAVHPGYGFLSEDPDFAEICQSHGLTFVGPPAEVMARLGDKAVCRGLMADAGLPMLPGSTGPVDTAAEAVRLAGDIGYPVIVKATAGGGGRGMSVVRDPDDLPAAYARTRRTAEVLFGDGSVYLERFLDRARHVEIQVLCDTHGNGVHLGERDCSVQRRHQKLLEETPAPGLPAGTVERMGAAAVRGARAVGFLGAGTFEFLVDGDGDFHFMEINGRIQVEHPVTEAVTGLDLVAEQLRVASGLPISTGGQEVPRRGAAIECRINAEDPGRGFVPTPGVLAEFAPPGGPFTRVDSHASAGMEITADYDSLVAKLVVWGGDRDEAIARAGRALAEFRVAGPGIATTAGFLLDVLAHPRFRAGTHTTGLVSQMLPDDPAPAPTT
ncbi:MAG TPA: biotin carboxylase N-terminal domain-containing protein [Mycobacteriales bacterium]|nr:biotin carboxylase N-terminal domain-containing protein [Mycobacteriales bacterium]